MGYISYLLLDIEYFGIIKFDSLIFTSQLNIIIFLFNKIKNINVFIFHDLILIIWKIIFLIIYI